MLGLPQVHTPAESALDFAPKEPEILVFSVKPLGLRILSPRFGLRRDNKAFRSRTGSAGAPWEGSALPTMRSRRGGCPSDLHDSILESLP